MFRIGSITFRYVIFGFLCFVSVGVHTKFGKYATTYFVEHPELLEVVSEWDKEVHSILPENGLWFAPGLPETGETDPFNIVPGNNSDRRARKDLKEWLEQMGSLGQRIAQGENQDISTLIELVRKLDERLKEK